MRLRNHLFLISLGLLVAIVAAGLVSGSTGFGPEPQSAEAALLTEVRKLLASDAQASDLFGVSVAVSGDTAVVGALQEDDGGADAGAAYVFRRDQGGTDNWGEVTKLTASDAQASDQFGYRVAVSGDTAVVGAWAEDAGGVNAGAAYVFRRDEGGADNWGQVTKLTASDAQAGDAFGNSVAVSGDTAIVGAPLEDAEGSDVGAAYVFQQPAPASPQLAPPQAGTGSSSGGESTTGWLFVFLAGVSVATLLGGALLLRARA